MAPCSSDGEFFINLERLIYKGFIVFGRSGKTTRTLVARARETEKKAMRDKIFVSVFSFFFLYHPLNFTHGWHVT